MLLHPGCRTIVLLLLTVLCIKPAIAQNVSLQRQLQESHYLKYVMKADRSDAGITRWLKKKVTNSRQLPLAEDVNSLKLKGPGSIRIDKANTISGKGSILLETPTSLAVKNPSNRSYASAELIRPIKRENLHAYNRFSVWVYADAPGFYTFFIGCTLYNEGEHIMPTPGRFEGQHFVTVYPGKWQQIIWELPDLYRDAVTGLSVNIMLTGSPQGAGDNMKLYVDDMRLEQVEAENSRGFHLRSNAIAYSHSGYKSGSVKQALVQQVATTKFQLVDAAGKLAFSGEGKKLDSGFVQLDFSSFNKPGFYTLAIDGRTTKPFGIGDDAYLATAWRTLNFFFAERCGYNQPGIHQQCHLDVTTAHPDGRTVNVSGGWHDAADLTQGIGNTARGGLAMLQLADAVKTSNETLYQRLLDEARWGLEWALKTRFGDGYRNGGLIIGIWTDNINGTKDDMQGKASNNPADNFIAASYCAVAARMYQQQDKVFSALCRKAAIEDFKFASELLGMAANDRNETELYAGAMVSAMHLYRLTREQSYLDMAAQYAHVVMDGQQKERRTDWQMPLHGFFYESRSKKRILEYFHRSNEHLMVQGLSMLLLDAPNHPDAPLWKTSCQAYADYLHDISTAIAPYGILPAAVYELNNAEFAGIYHEGEKIGLPSMEEYNAQVKNGIHLGGNFYLRRFPVAYQFRGFHAVLMGKAKAAFILSALLKDKALADIATRQLEYIIGYNPFAMSTIYGDGYDYPPLYGAYAGDVVGAVPVGIETFENEDEPYMPMQVNATYKEIWTHTTADVMWLVAALFKK
ncbi:glycoside hydrolase family 9 protein [Foetidibacter luteolus]|uniref:glycoside hydrolase family 9 protein n=1 Tax=Foetidibacter luteolus TaxID=2608880 RepID=UPI00129AD54B|nr:glycoside hydrolase family 9 protein [Foetidibacter luteolus]